MDIPKITDFFYNLTHLDILVTDLTGHVMGQTRTLSCPEALQPCFLRNEQHLLALTDALQPGQHRQEFLPGFHICYLLLRPDEQLRVLVGPYTYQDVPDDAVAQILRAQAVPKAAHDACRRFYLTLPKNFRAAALSASLLLSLLQNGFSESNPVSSADEPPARRSSPRKYGALQAIRNAPYQYEEENRIRAAVRSGNTEAALRHLSLGLHRFEYRSDHVTMWHMEHMLTVMGTIMRLAAHEGGAAPQTVHKISERYFFLIPVCKGSDDAGRLLTQMAEEYCQAVRESRSGACSPITQAALSYLQEHFQEHVTLREIADSIPCHPTYLCGLFKREVKATLFQTLTDLRTEYAAVLLSDPARSVSQIYRESGFESYQRFSTAFKKKFGCSCSQWRKNRQSLSVLPSDTKNPMQSD